jgi:hypothetical protein
MRKRSLKRASEPQSASTEHYARIADDFGRPRRGRYTASDDGAPMTGSRFWFQPVTLFFLSILALLMVSGLQLWRLGWFGVWFGAKSAQVDKSSKRWQLDGRRAAPVDAEVTDIDEPDIDRSPPQFEEIDAPPVTD